LAATAFLVFGGWLGALVFACWAVYRGVAALVRGVWWLGAVPGWFVYLAVRRMYERHQAGS
jgi:uncharacterized membrane protein YjdF